MFDAGIEQKPGTRFNYTDEISIFENSPGLFQLLLKVGGSGIQNVVVQGDGHPPVPQFRNDIESRFQGVAVKSVGIVSQTKHDPS